MTKSKNAKKALLASVLSIVLCLAMLVGTTFAWFTDSVTSAGNKIVAGNLKVDLVHVVDNGDISIKDHPDHKIFDYDKWEPGYTAMETLKVVNNGNLALKFRLDAVAADATAGPNGEKLADVIDVWVYEGEGENSAASFADIIAENSGWRNAGSLADFMADPDGIARGVLLPTGAEKKNEPEKVGSVQMTVALHMQESAGNVYQGLTLGSLNFILNAAQYTYEDDAFDDQYDAKADLPTVVIKTESDLEEYGNGTTTQKRFVFETPASNSDPTTAVVTGSIDTGTTSIANINDASVPGIKAIVPESVNTLIFSDMEFNGAVRGLTTRLTDAAQWEPAGILETVKFVNCTFNGVWYGNLGDVALNVEFENCKFTNQTIADRYSLFISYSTKWGYADEQRALTFTNCDFASVRAMQITYPDGVNIKFIGNTFTLPEGSTYGICLNSDGANSKNLFGDIEIYNNTLKQGKQLVTVYKGYLSMKDGAMAYLDGNTVVAGAAEVGGKSSDSYDSTGIVYGVKP